MPTSSAVGVDAGQLSLREASWECPGVEAAAQQMKPSHPDLQVQGHSQAP